MNMRKTKMLGLMGVINKSWKIGSCHGVGWNRKHGGDVFFRLVLRWVNLRLSCRLTFLHGGGKVTFLLSFNDIRRSFLLWRKIHSGDNHLFLLSVAM